MTIYQRLGLTEERAKEIAIDVVKEIQRNPVQLESDIVDRIKQKYSDINEYTFAIISLEHYIMLIRCIHNPRWVLKSYLRLTKMMRELMD